MASRGREEFFSQRRERPTRGATAERRAAEVLFGEKEGTESEAEKRKTNTEIHSPVQAVKFHSRRISQNLPENPGRDLRVALRETDRPEETSVLSVLHRLKLGALLALPQLPLQRIHPEKRQVTPEVHQIQRKVPFLSAPGNQLPGPENPRFSPPNPPKSQQLLH